jgi:uncharacterized membrane-anchored protein
MASAIERALKTQQRGTVNLGAGLATLNLPEGYGFLPGAEGAKLLEAMGNRHNQKVLGLVLPARFPAPEAAWFMVVQHQDVGHVSDEDAKDWKADDLLKGLREGVAETNKERPAGEPEFEVLGWIEPPSYDAAHRRLVWSVAAHPKGTPQGDDDTVNYNTLALGREGFISMNLVADRGHIEALRPVAKGLLGTLDFSDGKRYADFNASTDRVAEYGLAALVAGVAAKKLGLLAGLALVFAKSFKLIIAGGIALLALVGKLFGRRKARDSTAA